MFYDDELLDRSSLSAAFFSMLFLLALNLLEILSHAFKLATILIDEWIFAIFLARFFAYVRELPGRPPSGDSLTFIFSDDDQHHH